jgi:hypothetical protein
MSDDKLKATGSDSKSVMDLKVASVVPLHAATAPAKRGRGRPKKINPKPSADDLVYHAEMQRQQIDYVNEDAIVKAAQDHRDSPEMLHLLKERIARAAATLEFRRIETEKYGKDSAQTISRQIAALKEIANIELEIRKLGAQVLDLKGEQFQKIFELFIGKIRDVASAVFTTEQFDLFFNRLETALDGWEEEAQDIIR